MQNSAKFIKKITSKGPASSPEARAIRLKKLRNMANLSRRQICDECELNVHTYRGWEIGRYGGLPLDGAKKVINRVVEDNVVCSLDWLLHGEGAVPIIVVEQGEIAQDKTGSGVLQEILLYKSLRSEAVFTEIIDDSMTPKYNIGDYVAGEKKLGSEIDTLINENCIVQLVSGETLVRKLRKNEDDGAYILICTNDTTSVKQAILCKVKLKFAAPIARHYIK